MVNKDVSAAEQDCVSMSSLLKCVSAWQVLRPCRRGWPSSCWAEEVAERLD